MLHSHGFLCIGRQDAIRMRRLPIGGTGYPEEYNTFHQYFDDMNCAMKGNMRFNLTRDAKR